MMTSFFIYVVALLVSLQLVSAFTFISPKKLVKVVMPPLFAATVVKEMDVGSKKVICYDGDYSDAVVDLVVETAKNAIAAKGSFSLAIPGGSVVTALKALDADSFDMSKVHIFFCNERIGANKCYQGALDAFVTRCSIPLEQVYQVPELEPEEAASAYEKLIIDCPAVDVSSENIPSVDLVLLGTGDDGHCGSLYPQSNEIKATGCGKMVLGINEGDKKSIAVSMDFMNAAKKVLVSAAESKRATMVKRALTGDFEEWGCPAGLVECSGETIWFVDTDSIAEYAPTASA
jgi:6-phosphogluconolactonase